jgi:hypothetical protein
MVSRQSIADNLIHLAGMKKSTSYIVNGLMMLLVFFLARIVLMTRFVYDFVIYFHEFANASPLHRFWSLPSVAVVYYLNFTWFFKMVRGAIKLLKGKEIDDDTDVPVKDSKKKKN